MVSAEIRVGNETKWVQRGEQGLLWGPKLAELSKVRPQDELLKWLTGGQNAFADGAGLQAWFAGTRWLYGSNLGVLIDSDPAYAPRRKKVFADLLGIGHLEEAVRKSKAYISNTKPFFEYLQGHIQEKTADYNRALSAASPVTASVGEDVTRVRSLLGLPSDNRDPASQFQELAEAAARQRAALDERHAALTSIRTALNAVEDVESQDASDAIQLQQSKESATLLAKHLEDVERDRASAIAELDRAKSARAGIIQVLPDLEEAVKRVEPLLGGLIDPAAGAGDLKARYPEADWTTDRVNRRHRELDDLLGQLPTAEEAILQLEHDRRDLDARGGVPSEDLLATLPHEIAREQAALDNLDKQVEALSGPIERLRAAGRSALEALDDTHHCPLCSHDWNKAEHLRAAIRETLSATPPALFGLQQQQHDQRSRLEPLRISYQRAKEAVALADRISANQTIIDRFNQAVEASGIKAGITDIRHAIRDQREKLDMAAKVGSLLRLVPLAASKAEAAFDPGEPLVKQASDMVVALHRREAEAGQWFDETEKKLEALDGKRRTLAEQRQSFDAEATRIEDRIGQRQIARDRVHGSWKRLSDQPLTQEALDAVTATLDREEESLATAQTLLRQVEAVLQATEAQRKLLRLKAELDEKQHQHTRLAARRALAQSLQQKCTDHQRTLIQQQLSRLRPTVQAFFLRMHANRFIEEVSLDFHDDTLEWLATAKLDPDGEPIPLKPGQHLSDGQRQDLALSIFLARAGALGGTFFLDEPLVHLDELNRVAVLDILRLLVTRKPDLGIVLTTTSYALARHIKEKFRRVPSIDGRPPALRIIELSGNPAVGVTSRPPEWIT